MNNFVNYYLLNIFMYVNHQVLIILNVDVFYDLMHKLLPLLMKINKKRLSICCIGSISGSN